LTIKTIDKEEREKRKQEMKKMWIGVEERLLEFSWQFYVSQMLL